MGVQAKRAYRFRMLTWLWVLPGRSAVSSGTLPARGNTK